MQRSSQRGASALGVCLLLLLLAVLDLWALAQLGAPGAAEGLAAARAAAAAGDAGGALAAASGAHLLPWLAVPVLGPLVVALVAALSGGRSAGAPVQSQEQRATADAGSARANEPETKRAPAAPPPSPASGLRLLATLQEEARLLDFVREDIDGYTDEQVGGAVRGIHAALRKAIDGRLTLEPILPGEDGDRVEVPAGFEPALIRVVGRPPAKPPFRGVLRHGGWRAREVSLPSATPGSDPAILMPAEVEVE
jgi:uncharacterized protein DUF2760